MTVEFEFSRADRGGVTVESIVLKCGVVRVVPSSNPRFDALKDYLLNTPAGQLEADKALQLADVGINAINKLRELSSRVSYNPSTQTLFFDGDEIKDGLAQHIVRMIVDGDDNYEAYVNLLENIRQNPSKKARKAVFDYIADRNFTVTPEGHFVAYKGVYEDGRSIHSGRAYVNGVLIEGQIPNSIGDVVTMPRLDVNSDRDIACSEGLHVGTRSYASSYGNRMLIVAVNPRDVVMVPRDGNGQKVRVCRYVVLDNNEAELTQTTYESKHSAKVAQPTEDEPEAEDFDPYSDGNTCPECGEAVENGEVYCSGECEDYAYSEQPFEDDVDAQPSCGFYGCTNPAHQA